MLTSCRRAALYGSAELGTLGGEAALTQRDANQADRIEVLAKHLDVDLDDKIVCFLVG